MKKAYIFLFVCFILCNTIAFSQHTHAEDNHHAVIFGVYDQKMEDGYFSKELGNVNTEFNGYFYSYYSDEMPTQAEAEALQVKARGLGYITAAATTLSHASHPCVFCASLRDTACWSGLGNCALPGYARHDNFNIFGTWNTSNHGVNPAIEVRDFPGVKPTDIAGTTFYYYPYPMKANVTKIPMEEVDTRSLASNELHERPLSSPKPKVTKSAPASAVSPKKAVVTTDAPEINTLASRGVTSNKTITPATVKITSSPTAKVAAPAITQKVTYMAQIGAFSTEKNITVNEPKVKLVKEKVGSVTRYMVGPFVSREECQKFCDKISGEGFSDAFPVSYLEGKRQK